MLSDHAETGVFAASSDEASVEAGVWMGELTCEEPYGYLPCSTGMIGNVFLMIVYVYILINAAKWISDGSELLLKVLNPGLIGGLLLPLLGAFPDAFLIAVAGMKGTASDAQDQVLVGMGVLAGSTIMILTIAWAGSLILGRCDLTGPDGTAKDKTHTKGCSLTETGVTTDTQTRYGAWIMMASTLPYFIIQGPLILSRHDKWNHAALAGAIVCWVSLVVYCCYQVWSPSLQEQKIVDAQLRLIKSRALQGMRRMATDRSMGGLFLGDGFTPNPDVVGRLFNQADMDGNGYLGSKEIRALIVGLELPRSGHVPTEEEVHAWMKEFDMNQDGKISPEEFASGLSRWAHSMATTRLSMSMAPGTAATLMQCTLVAADPNGSHRSCLLTHHEQDADRLIDKLRLETAVDDDDDDEEELTRGQVYMYAALYMAAGTALVSLFAGPLVESMTNFSAASHIPPFFVAFVVSPFATNSSELVSSLIFAMKKRQRNISLTYSQVYGAITMNNTLCLGIFLTLVYARNLTWNFSAEVLVILLSVFVVGAVSSLRNTFAHWMAYPTLGLYPAAIGIVLLLESFGWD